MFQLSDGSEFNDYEGTVVLKALENLLVHNQK